MTAEPIDEEPVGAEGYQRLLAFRMELRSFLRWSEQAAHEAGLTPSIHQLLLVIRGHHTPSEGPTVGEIAEALHVRHHSAVELAQRADAIGLVRRVRDRADHRRVHLRLTRAGAVRLETLTREHLARIATLARTLEGVVREIPFEA